MPTDENNEVDTVTVTGESIGEDEIQESTIRVSEKADSEGIAVEEMGAADKAKFWLAKVVLLGSAVLMLIAWLLYASFAIWGLPDVPSECIAAGETKPFCEELLKLFGERLDAASNVFEFAKSWIPPVITLVLGYYFAREDKNSEG